MSLAHLSLVVVVALWAGGCSRRGTPSESPVGARASAPAPRPAPASPPVPAPAPAPAPVPGPAITSRPAPSGGACRADLQQDPLNCGACARACPSVARTLPVCVAGSCRHACRVGYAECDGDPATVCETEILRDPCHCSRCGVRCPPGLFCVAGSCQGRQDALVRTGPRAPASCDGWRMPAARR